MPPTFLDRCWRRADPAPTPAEFRFVAGLGGAVVTAEQAVARGAPAVEIVRRAQALERTGLEIVPYLFVDRSSAGQLTRFFDLLSRNSPEDGLPTVVQRPPFAYSAVAAALREVVESWPSAADRGRVPGRGATGVPRGARRRAGAVPAHPRRAAPDEVQS